MEPKYSENSYWNAVGLAGLIFGLIIFVMGIIGGYMTINAEPRGTLFTPYTVLGVISCLAGAFGGMLAVRFHINEYPQTLPIGRGAVIGLMTGVAIAVVSTVFGLLWNVIDPDFTEKLMESQIEDIEAMDLPQSEKESMIDSIAASMQRMTTPGGIVLSLLMNSLLFGVLNLLTGLLGVRFFASGDRV